MASLFTNITDFAKFCEYSKIFTSLFDSLYNAFGFNVSFVVLENDFSAVENCFTSDDLNNDNLFEKKLNKRFRIQTKKPYWDASTKKYKLDFKGRATRASSNNFQLIDCESNSLVYQCAKWKSNLYNIDFKYPINAFQAFGIAISCLSKK